MPQTPSNTETMGAPSGADRGLLYLWAVSSVLGAISLIATTFGTVTWAQALGMMELNRFPSLPVPELIAFGAMTIVSILTTTLALRRDTFSGHLRQIMMGGSAAALMGYGLFLAYMGPLSKVTGGHSIPAVGEQAPDFAIVDPTGRTWRLSDFRRDVLLVFYRAHW